MINSWGEVTRGTFLFFTMTLFCMKDNYNKKIMFGQMQNTESESVGYILARFFFHRYQTC